MMSRIRSFGYRLVIPGASQVVQSLERLAVRPYKHVLRLPATLGKLHTGTCRDRTFVIDLNSAQKPRVVSMHCARVLQECMCFSFSWLD